MFGGGNSEHRLNDALALEEQRLKTRFHIVQICQQRLHALRE